MEKNGIIVQAMLIKDQEQYSLLLVEPVEGRTLISLTSSDENAATVANVLGIKIHNVQKTKSWQDSEEVAEAVHATPVNVNHQ